MNPRAVLDANTLPRSAALAPMSPVFDRYLQEHLDTFSRLGELRAAVEQSAELMADTLQSGGKLLFCGNGGSAADSQHLAAELTGRFIEDRPPLAAIALSTDTSALTCIANDYSFADVFERQVRALGRAGDCLVGISTSGGSQNVLRAMRRAQSLGLKRVGLLGRDGGEIAPLCDLAVVVPSRITARIQEAHIFIGHTWCALIEQLLRL